MKISSYDIVFQEVPGEVTLALNISNCPNRCEGCHSRHLWEDVGEVLTDDLMDNLLETYGDAITCVALMGGDAEPAEVNRWLAYIHARGLKTAWYSGRAKCATQVELKNLDYLKLGPYIEALGGLSSPTTNQKLYRIEEEKLILLKL